MSRMLKCAIRECNKSDFVSYFSFFAKQKRRIIISCGFERLEIKKNVVCKSYILAKPCFCSVYFVVLMCKKESL